jgi:hypothetical protein
MVSSTSGADVHPEPCAKSPIVTEPIVMGFGIDATWKTGVSWASATFALVRESVEGTTSSG